MYITEIYLPQTNFKFALITKTITVNTYSFTMEAYHSSLFILVPLSIIITLHY